MQKKRVYTVYMHTNLINNKKYIGITRQKPERRFRTNGYGYKGCSHFYSAIQKYGWDNFKHEVLFCNLTQKEAEMFEVELIKYYKSNNKKYGYNIQNGGQTQYTISDIGRENLRKSHLGKKVSEQTKQKIRLSMLNRYGENNPMYGKGKKVICLETGEIFNSVRLAGDKFNIDTSSIIKVCRNKRKTVNKLTFRYI